MSVAAPVCRGQTAKLRGSGSGSPQRGTTGVVPWIWSGVKSPEAERRDINFQFGVQYVLYNFMFSNIHTLWRLPACESSPSVVVDNQSDNNRSVALCPELPLCNSC